MRECHIKWVKTAQHTEYFSQKKEEFGFQFWENYFNLPGLLGKRAVLFPPVIHHICNYVFLFGYPNTNTMVSTT